MTLYAGSQVFISFFPLDWSYSVSRCDRIIYNLNAAFPPTPSICLSTPALHQLSLSPFTPPSLFFLPSPVFFFFFSLFVLFSSLQNNLIYSSSSPLPILSFPVSQPWVVGVCDEIYGICSVTSSQTYRVLAD